MRNRILLLVLCICSTSALGASTSISDTPMALMNAAKANVMFTLDSSGGMDVEVLVPTYNSMYYENGVTPGNNPKTLNGNFFMFPLPYRNTLSLQRVSYYLEGDVGSLDLLHYRARNSVYNAQYYDPYKTYYPWSGTNKIGQPFGNATPTAALIDPYDPSMGSVDLTREMVSGIGGVPLAHTYLSLTGTDITASGGRFYNSTWFPAVYYAWVDSNANKLMDVGEGVRYEIKPAGSQKTDPSATIPSGLYPSGRTYTDEMQNFANWFQYSRTVMLSLKSALGNQLDTLGSVQVGMTYLEPANIPYPVADMSIPSNVATLRSGVYSVKPNLYDWRQPFHERLSQVFNYFSQTGAGAPIQYACQQNFNVLATPGYLNENGPGAAGFKNYFTGVTPSSPFTTIGDYDSTTHPNSKAGQAPYDDYALLSGTSIPDTLADWSMFIYDTNLRPDLATGQVPISPTSNETNANLHLDTYVLAPGAKPQLQTTGAMLNPMTTDPYKTSINWPKPNFVDLTTLDDLWHASVNSRGYFVNNTDINGGLSILLTNILAKVGSSAAVAVSNANVSPGDNFSYSSSYNGGNWSGDLISNPIDLTTGQPIPTTPRWIPSAQGQLDNQVLTTGRKIATYTGAIGVPFRYANLTTAQQPLLNTPTSITPDGANVLAFLRGDRSKEGLQYRVRSHVLGDIINAEPVIVRVPSQLYTDNGYLTYKTNYTNVTPRKSMVYQAANDGMLHAFDATNGNELWAYVPNLLFNSRLVSSNTTSTLENLSSKDNFRHLYMVDGTPTSSDVDFGNTCTSGCPSAPTGGIADWHSLLVGGLRKGGRGYYALDVTQPVVATEADVAAKAIWEFPNSSTPNAVIPNIGFSYGKPVITKTRATGWVVIVTSGYNNGTNTGDSGGDGQGHLFVLNAKTGSVIKDITTGVGSATSPAGLGKISGYAQNANSDNTVDYVYGGDLQGNVWRFDLTSTSTANWKALKLASLVDPSGMPQPITTMPQLALVSGKHMVYVGTGKYLDIADISNQQIQTMYGLVDDLSNTITPLRTQLVQQLATINGASLTLTNRVLGKAKGWYIDLPNPGERIVTDPSIALNTLVFSTNIPSASNPCSPGGSSWLYFLNYVNGGQAQGNSSAGIWMGNVLSSRPILVKLPDGTIKAIIRKSNAQNTVISVPVPSTTLVPGRVSWREIIIP